MTLSWVEISRSRLAHNVRIIRSRIPTTTQIIAVVKADGYGHGMELVCRILQECGIQRFAVANLEEAIELRRWAKQEAILVFSGCQKGEEEEFRRNRLTASVYDDRTLPCDLPVEIKIDTGMTRLGIPWTQARKFLECCPLNLKGVFSNFAAADKDPGFTRLQLKRFLDATDGMGQPRHICNSAGLALPEAHLDAVRLGLSLYGISPGPPLGPLEPILTWKARLLSAQEIPAGRAIGYGATFCTQRKTRTGVVAAGYADGYNRLLSNRGTVLVSGKFAPVLGRVSMDLISVDLTEIPEATPGDEVILLDSDPGSPISAVALATQLQTIPYEILTSIGSRVAKRMVD